jgi:putative ABC transport system substrate-binding protein
VYRYTRGDSTRFDALAAELVSEKPDLIFAGIQASAVAAKKATRDIPIVFAFVADPAGSGLVASLARPGGNATGLAGASVEMSTKRLELLKEIRPRLRNAALIVARGALGDQTRREIERAARPMGVKVNAIAVGNQAELEKALSSLAGMKAEGLLFLAGGMMARNLIAKRVADLRLPAVYSVSEMIVSGGLLSYGADLMEHYRHAAEYVDRILKGAKPADLPVELPRTFELAVNLKTARAQGIEIPQSVLIRATRVIE